MRNFVCFILFSGLLGMCSCNSDTSDWKKSSTGKPYEVFVVMDDDDWAGEVGDTLRSIFWEPFPMLNQYEPLYSVFQSNEKQFSGLLQQYRNVLVYRADPRLKETTMRAEYDKWATPQIVVWVMGPTDDAMVEYMDLHRYALQQIFDIAEQDRFINRANLYADKDIREKVSDRFGLSINIPKGYSVRAEHPDFIWISYELPLVSQGIIIYKYPLESRRTFTPEYLFEKRNEFAAFIPGPSAGSYMKTSSVMLPEVTQTDINGRIWFRSQGFWDVAGDFMGGPYTAYSTVNATTREVINIDTYVFSPKYDKRNYVRQVQALALTARIPNDTVTSINFAELPE